MTLQALTATAVLLMLSLCVLYLVRRLGVEIQMLPVTTDWLSELSVDRYRPMMRLLDASDFLYLRQQKGFTPEMGRRLRKQRAAAFEGYLRLLQVDFKRVATALDLILAQSGHDRPELASVLLHRRFVFACRVVEAQVRLTLFRFGWDGLDGAELIRMFDGMRLELRELVPASAFAMA
ncbi:MAG: hypothetical protein ABI759_10510 [Candidatus Solibacter sp.]